MLENVELANTKFVREIVEGVSAGRRINTVADEARGNNPLTSLTVSQAIEKARKILMNDECSKVINAPQETFELKNA